MSRAHQKQELALLSTWGEIICSQAAVHAFSTLGSNHLEKNGWGKHNGVMAWDMELQGAQKGCLLSTQQALLPILTAELFPL